MKFVALRGAREKLVALRGHRVKFVASKSPRVKSGQNILLNCLKVQPVFFFLPINVCFTYAQNWTACLIK